MKIHMESSTSRNKAIAHPTRIFFILLLVFLTSPITPARADTSVCGVVSGNWTSAGNDYIVTCDIQIANGSSLTIQPGVVVKFDDGTSLRVDGELVAQGVTFTSSSDTPSQGIWGHIYFTTTSEDAVFDAGGNYLSGSIIQDSLVEWGGGGTGVNGEVEVVGASPFLDHNTILNSSTRGIYAIGRSSTIKIIIYRNTVSSNHGGIYASAASLDENVVSNNNTDAAGGGISVSDSILTNNLVSSNSGGNGGGINASGSILTGNTVSGNSGVYSGGGIQASGCTLTENLVTGNYVGACYGDTTAVGGGISASGGSVVGNTISGNTAATSAGFYCMATHGKGGGLYASLSTVSENVVTGNYAHGNANGYGGGISGSSSTITENTVTGNSANAATGNGYGGGIYADGGTVTDNQIHNNAVSSPNDAQGGGIYGNINTIQGNNLTFNSANRGGAIYSYQGMVTSNTVMTNTAALTGAVYMNEGTALNNYLQGNSAVNGGGVYGYQSNLTGNTSVNNTANIGAGILAYNSTVRGNTLTGNTANSDGGGLYADGGTITSNTMLENTVPSFGHGSGAYLTGVIDFNYNHVRNNTASGGTAGGVSINGQTLMQYNNLYDNLPYDMEVISSDIVTGTLNYWGPAACNDIPLQIYDGNDVPGRGELIYAPSLYLPSPVTQLDAPTNLTIEIEGSSTTLAWEPIIPIPNIGCRVPGSDTPDVRYLVYYDTDDACAPYSGKGLPQGDSAILVDQATMTLNLFEFYTYFFSVTAYDYLGRESSYTNIVSRPNSGYSIWLPVIKR